MPTLQERYYSLLATLTPKKTAWGVSATRDADFEGINTKIVDLILEQAAIEGASDIHVEPVPESDKLRIRFRIDGVLYEKLMIDEIPNVSIIPRIKVMANLETDARMMRKPQDGRFSVNFAKQNLDFRVATFPTVRGEKVAIRLLYKDSGLFRLDRIGLDPFDMGRVAGILKSKYGLLVVSGPTGCGKTTSLYAILNQLNSPDINIVTLEDPVEYQLDGLNQCDIRKKMDFNFPDALRAALRQDPDIILVGEMRDAETCEIAIRASLTGHLVLTTLHASSTIGTIVRLLNMGLEPYLVSYALLGAVAQRLVRKICPECKVEYEMTPEEINRMKLHYRISLDSPDKSREDAALYSFDQNNKTVFFKGQGCAFCNGTGYKGRIGLFEIVTFNDSLREAILKGASSSDLRKLTIQNGTKPVLLDGIEKAKRGITTLDEVFSVAFER